MSDCNEDGLKEAEGEQLCVCGLLESFCAEQRG